MYIDRHITATLQTLIAQFPAVLLTGARQVGKSTLLKHIAGEEYSYVTFDDPRLIQQVRTDPGLFLLDHPGKLILDEIQLAPELLTYLKMEIDRKGENGMYLLSGSQAYHLMQHVSESMAGRIAIVNLAGLSLRETHGLPSPGPLIPSQEQLQRRGRALISNDGIWSFIFQGQYPRLHTDNANREAWYSAYTATYIERDVRQLMNIVDTDSFMKFLSSIAARSGELLNYASVAKDIGVSGNTVKNWLNILQASGVIFILPAWSGNHLKRALKTPKVYFLDTGLLAWLTRWPSADTIRMGAKAGQFFETYVISEVVKSAYNSGLTRPELYFYRDKDQREIDLIIQDGRTIYPVEIKMSATPSLSMVKHFEVMTQIAATDHLDVGTGTILCQCPELLHLDRNILAVPVQYL